MTITDEKVQAQVVIAASIIAGAGASEDQVIGEVRRIASRLDAGSPAMNVFADLERRNDVTEKVKTFRAVILHVDKEVTSTRAVIFLKTAPSKYHPNGKELARTARTDTVEGKALAKRAQELIGHQVLLSVGVENPNGDNKVRVIRHIEDQGVMDGFDPQTEEWAPDLENPKNHTTLARLMSSAAAAARQRQGVAPHEKLVEAGTAA